MITDLSIVVVEIGYVAGAAVISQGVRFLARRIHQARTASAIRKMLEESREPPKPERPAGYRDNATTTVEATLPSPSMVERWRAKRAATYVHELERRAKIDA